ncbi:MAG: hypothetical protein ACLP0J_27020 [Solirubrobacteraceae bacterium]
MPRLQRQEHHSGSYTFSVTASNAEGTSSPSSASRRTTILLYPTAPAVTTPANNADTNDNTPAFSGTAEPGSTVTVTIDTVAPAAPVIAAPVNGSASNNVSHRHLHR